MRGLTANERFILSRLASDPPGYVRSVADEPQELHETRAQLIKDGRCGTFPYKHPDGSDGTMTDITPVGRLALRLDTFARITFVS